MTDPSLQKMQTTPGSNMQKMHIPHEWVEVHAKAAFEACPLHEGIDWADPVNDEDKGYQFTKRGWYRHISQAALTAVIPLIRADAERERDRYKDALERIACFHDQFGNAGLTTEGTYSGFDEPVSVKIARQALEGEA